MRTHIDFAYQTRTYFGLYEIELNRYLRGMLRFGMTAFDIGGQHGYDALVIAKHTQAWVASFECDPAQIARMTAIDHRGLICLKDLNAPVTCLT